MPTLRAVVWGTRVALACALTGFGVYLLVRAWDVPLDGSGAVFTPMAFMGALVCFGSAAAFVVPHHAVPRSGSPAAR
ncbi:MAG TPA: hypothetical protein VH274_05740 [Mycobacteriales bacterium]|jgi:hypothetical protein|nr:hypothetical protein [Mycobacteriales bacterium]